MRTRAGLLSVVSVLLAAGSALAGPLARIYIAPQEVGLVTSAKQQFQVVGEDADGTELAVPTPVTWTTSAAAGTITTAGLFTASYTPGRYWNAVTVTVPGGFTATASIDVYSNEPRNGYVVERSIGGLYAGTFNSPAAICIDGSEHILTVDSAASKLRMFDIFGRLLSETGLKDPVTGKAAIAASASGEIFLLNPNIDKIQRYSARGAFVNEWGSPGSGQGQFTEPSDVAVGPDGLVYVVESGNSRVQVFTAAGAYVREFPIQTLGWGAPAALAFDGAGVLYVGMSDSSWEAVQRLDAQGGVISRVRSEETYDDLTDIVVDASGNMILLYQDTVLKIAPDGDTMAVWGHHGQDAGLLAWPSGVAVDAAGRIYVADQGNHRLQVFSPDGALERMMASAGNQKGQFRFPSGAAVDGSGNLFVADPGNYRAQQFGTNAILLRRFASKQRRDNPFACPAGVTVDPAGAVILTDSLMNRLLAYSSSGTLLRNWPLPDPTGEVHTVSPMGVTCSILGHTWITDAARNYVYELDPAGSVVRTWGSKGSGDGQFSSPSGIALDSQGNLLVSDYGNNRVQKFTSAGAYASQFGEAGSGNGQFLGPAGICTDSSGWIYVADQGNCRVQKFSSAGFFAALVGSEGYGKSDLQSPQGVWCDPLGKLHIADTGNHRVQQLAPYVVRPISVTIGSPAAETLSVTEPTLSLTGATTGTVTAVTWSNDRGGSGACAGTSAWSISGVPLKAGPNVVAVAARDSAGNTVTDSLTVSYSENVPPAVSITTPTADPVYSTTAMTLDVAGTSSDNSGVEQVLWWNSRGGSGICSGTTPWSAAGVQLAPGENVIRVVCRDGSGNSSTDVLTVTYADTEPPVLAITGPTAGAAWATRTSNVQLVGTASDNCGVTSVRWTSSRGPTGYGYGEWYCYPALYSGENVITVTAYDSSNNAGSDTVTVVYASGTPVTVAGARAKADGSIVFIENVVVSAVFADCCYVQDSSRSAGLRVSLIAPVAGLTIGSRVDLAGTLQTQDGERCIRAAVNLLP